MEISYSTDKKPSAQQLIELFLDAGLKRPTDDEDRIQKMIDHADVMISAWQNDELIGVSRSISDWVWCCYLSDLAVKEHFKGQGIGKKLIELTQNAVGKQSMVLLLSAPTAMEYYPKVGFENSKNAFIIHREE